MCMQLHNIFSKVKCLLSVAVQAFMCSQVGQRQCQCDSEYEVGRPHLFTSDSRKSPVAATWGQEEAYFRSGSRRMRSDGGIIGSGSSVWRSLAAYWRAAAESWGPAEASIPSPEIDDMWNMGCFITKAVRNSQFSCLKISQNSVNCNPRED
jgi:hypothetical protein